MDFIYYMPNAQGASTADLAAWGLAHVGPIKVGTVEEGPDGNAGILMAAATSDVKLQVDRENTRWIAPDGDRKWWLGYHPQAAPGPAELQRADTIGGRPVTLADGNEWIAPVARLATEEGATSGLPMAYGLGEDGAAVSTVVDTWMHLWEMGGECVEQLAREAGWMAAKESDPKAPLPEGMMLVSRSIEIATAALAANYRVSAVELLAVGVLTDRNVQQIHETLIDKAGMMKIGEELMAAADAKKNDKV